jgi:hypothetical protein
MTDTVHARCRPGSSRPRLVERYGHRETIHALVHRRGLRRDATRIIFLREKERLAFKEIGRRCAMPPSQAAQIYRDAVFARDGKLRRDCWSSGLRPCESGTITELPTRACNVLLKAGLPRTATRHDVARLLPSLRLHMPTTRGLGRWTLHAIELWVSDFAFDGEGLA